MKDAFKLYFKFIPKWTFVLTFLWLIVFAWFIWVSLFQHLSRNIFLKKYRLRLWFFAYLLLLFTAAVESLSGVSTIKRILEKFSDKTVIMVTHRLDITKFVDKIYVMENGEIVESGSFQELLDKKTLFYDMYKYQLGE